MKRILIVFLILSVNIGFVNAQRTAAFSSPDNEYNKAAELFNKEKYGAARKIFEDVFAHSQSSNELKTNASYYIGLCAVKLFQPDAEELLSNFIDENTSSPNINYAAFQLANYLYSQKKFSKAIKYYENTNISELNADERAKLHFSKAYCYFQSSQFDKAKNAFFQVKDNDKSDYSSPATYYYSHILYTEKKYESSLVGFLKLMNDETFKGIAPYYITQIYYQQEKYDELLKIAPSLLDNANAKRAPEIARLIGDAYFKTAKYKEAIIYFKIYSDKTQNQLSRNDNYQFGYAYYKTEQFKNAIEYLQKAITAEDTLSQNIYYHLAYCYIKNDEKKFAMNAFQSAFKLDYDLKIKEDALFNYAKLSYEITYNPYNEAIKAFVAYLKEYPNSSRVDESYTFLVDMYMSAKNYKDALFSIENIKNKDSKLKTAYQKIAFYRAIELFNDNELNEAIKVFDKTRNVGQNNQFNALSLYWIAEAQYRLAKYDTALATYQNFIVTPGAMNTNYYNMANYNIAYCYFNTKEYSQALINFKKFINGKNKEDVKIINDAYIRAGDCNYVNKDYLQSIDYYNKAIHLNSIDNDYALYQKASALGILLNYNEKINILNELVSKFPKSSYIDDSRFELGKTYLINNQSEKALASFKNIIENHPKSSYLKESYLKCGLIYYNTNKDEDALTMLKKVVSDYPSTSESKAALITIRNIYIEQNKAQDYFSYVKNIPFTNVSNEEQDSILYLAAENAYINNDCNGAVAGFSDYLEKFPYGYFTGNAAYYCAECLMQQGKTAEALKHYKEVIDKPRSRFTENALINASKIAYQLKEYNQAIKYYTQLEESADYKSSSLDASLGIMRSYYNLKDYPKTIISAYKLLYLDKISDDNIVEARMKIAKSALEIDSIGLAQKEFATVTKLSKGEAGAESAYNLSLIFYKKENINEAENQVFDLINQYASYDYWVAKSFILLADIYMKKNNIFQAKQTLKSIIDNYTGKDEIKQSAIDKLVGIENFEKNSQENKPLNEEQEIKINDKF